MCCLAEFFSPVSLVWCSLGARGRNCLIEGVLPFSIVASKGTVCEEQNGGSARTFFLRWGDEGTCYSRETRAVDPLCGGKKEYDPACRHSSPACVTNPSLGGSPGGNQTLNLWIRNEDPMLFWVRDLLTWMQQSPQVPSGGQDTWGWLTYLHIHLGCVPPSEFLPLLLKEDRKEDSSMPFKMSMELKEEFIWKYPLPFPIILRKKKSTKTGKYSLCLCHVCSRRRVFRGDFMMEWKKWND